MTTQPLNVQSMTGFASTSCEFTSPETGTVTSTFSIKSLNGRSFEAICRFPHAFAALEQPMIQRSRELLKRGNVTIIMQFNSSVACKGAIVPSLSAAGQCIESLRAIQARYQIPGTLTISDLVSLPQLFETQEFALPPTLAPYYMAQLEKLLTTVLQARTHEGAALARELNALMDSIEQAVEELAPLADRITAERRERFFNDIQASIAAATPETRELHVQALYHNLHTIDTREEIVRLRTHQANFRATLADADSQKGKKLDFILQELLREINTLGAKLIDNSAITPVLTVKTKLEQAREQVQNIV